MSQWTRPLIKIVALSVFVGRPLFVADLLEPRWGSGLAFAFAPIALMGFAALTVLAFLRMAGRFLRG